MNRHRARWMRVAVTGALTWERSIRAGGHVTAFPFQLGRTELERALLHKILIRRWNHLAAGDLRDAILLMEAAIGDLRRMNQLMLVHQSVESWRTFDFIMRSFRIELSSFRLQAAIRAAG